MHLHPERWQCSVENTDTVVVEPHAGASACEGGRWQAGRTSGVRKFVWCAGWLGVDMAPRGISCNWDDTCPVPRACGAHSASESLSGCPPCPRTTHGGARGSFPVSALYETLHHPHHSHPKTLTVGILAQGAKSMACKCTLQGELRNPCWSRYLAKPRVVNRAFSRPVLCSACSDTDECTPFRVTEPGLWAELNKH